MNKKETMIPALASLSPNSHIYNNDLYTSGYVKDLKEQIEDLQQRIDKAIEYINNREWEDYPLQIAGHHKLKDEKEGKDLLNILRGEHNEK